MFKSSPLSSRNLFGRFLNERDLKGEAVEIGSHRGESAAQLLSCWNGKKLWCVDPWANLPGYEAQSKLLIEGWGGEGDRERDYSLAVERLKRWVPERCELLRETSLEALRRFADGSLDFVFVDGDHRRVHVLHDLEGWWPKLRKGGILAGHDWVQPGEKHRWAEEIQEALTEFLRGFDVIGKVQDVELIIEEGGLPWSYYMEKTL